MTTTERPGVLSRDDDLPNDTEGPAPLDREQSAALHRLFDPVLDEPIPRRMIELLRRTARRAQF